MSAGRLPATASSGTEKAAVSVYEVFARKARGEPLRHIGNLNAPTDDLAKVYAYNTYDEEKWFDMWVVPRERLLEVFNKDREAAAVG